MLVASRRHIALALPCMVALPASAAEPVALDVPRREVTPVLHGHRHAYVAGVGCWRSAGWGWASSAQGESRRAQGLTSARETRASLDRARTASATANVLYAAAGAAVLYGLLPEPAARAASLTYHF
ncbi:hypothetical protein [Myxococcus sp. NMCA1]|uniref:hypothetical protein n=1 Tax=Myxococcus sp. NMCA1 TaxID=2996785 RepID=UPI0022865C68|nr:hypothetical protein [Myxococcus sp. NMCA1]WAM29695.1 hypothetical protein OZ403_16835 [Myxococcus sp. NMCA1]